MVAASGPGKALWHPMATVHSNRWTPGKTGSPKKRSLGTPGGAGETADSPAPRFPATAPGSGRISTGFGMTLSNMGRSRRRPRRRRRRRSVICETLESLLPAASSPLRVRLPACVRRSWGRGRWVRHCTLPPSLPPSRRPSRIEPGIVSKSNQRVTRFHSTSSILAARVPSDTYCTITQAGVCLSCVRVNEHSLSFSYLPMIVASRWRSTTMSTILCEKESERERRCFSAPVAHDRH